MADVEPRYRATQATTNLVHLIDPSEGGILDYNFGRLRPSLTAAGILEYPAAPGAGSHAYGPYQMDYEVTERGVRPIAVDGHSIWMRGQWWSLSDDAEPALVAPSGARGSRTTNRFWLDGGFKLLPDGGTGFWMIGGLGANYVHVNADLDRDDRLSIFERTARLFEHDRAKGSFLDGETPAVITLARRASVPIVLFGLPLALLAAAIGQRLGKPRLPYMLPSTAIRTAAITYLGIALCFAWWAWTLIGYF